MTLKTLWINGSKRFLDIYSNLLRLICGKEFSNGKALCDQNDTAIYFPDPGTLSQWTLKENSNGLLRKEGLPKEMDFNQMDQTFITSVASKRNKIPRKSLDYQTPVEIFLSYLDESTLSSLNWQIKL